MRPGLQPGHGSEKMTRGNLRGSIDHAACPGDGHPPWECAAAIKRFWARVSVAGPDECWLWNSHREGGHKYGFIQVHKIMYPAQVFSWMVHNACAFPAGMQGCHSCDTPRCTNPAHIWPGTNADNQIDCRKKGRHPNTGLAKAIATRRGITHCKRGHPLSGDNVSVNAKGYRTCISCRKYFGNRRRTA